MCSGVASSILLLFLSIFCPLSQGSPAFLNISRGQRDEFTNTKTNCTDITSGRKWCRSLNAECSSNSSCCICRCLYSHSVYRYPECEDNAAIRSQSGCKYQFSASANSSSPLVILDLSKPGPKRIDAPRGLAANSSCAVVGIPRILDRGTLISSKNLSFSMHKTDWSYFEVKWKNVSGSLYSGRIMTVPVHCQVNNLTERQFCLLFKVQGTLTYSINTSSPTPTPSSTAVSTTIYKFSTTSASVGHSTHSTTPSVMPTNSVSTTPRVMPTRSTVTHIPTTVPSNTPESFLSWWPLSKNHFIIIFASAGFIITVLFILCIWLVCRRRRRNPKAASRGNVVRQSATHLLAHLEMMDVMSATNEAFTEALEEGTSPSPQRSPDCLRTDTSKVQMEPLYQNLPRNNGKLSEIVKERSAALTPKEHLQPLPASQASSDVLIAQDVGKENDTRGMQNDEDTSLPCKIAERESNKEILGDEEEQYEVMGGTPDAEDEDDENDTDQDEVYINDLPPSPSPEENSCDEDIYDLPPDAIEDDDEKGENGADQEYCYADYSQLLAERAQIEQHLRKSWPCDGTPPSDPGVGTDEPIYMNTNSLGATCKASTLAVPGCEPRAVKDDTKKRIHSWGPRTESSKSCNVLQKPQIPQENHGTVNSGKVERPPVVVRPKARASNQRGVAAPDKPKSHVTNGESARPRPKPRPLTNSEENLEDCTPIYGNIPVTQLNAPAEQCKSKGDCNDEETLYMNRSSYIDRFDVN